MVSTLYTFPGTELDGREPTGRLRHASDGKLYGASRVGGGGFSRGTLFALTTAGAFTKLHGFPMDDTARPAGSLVEMPGGALYGMAFGTGSFDGGFFRLSGQSSPPVTRAEAYTHTPPTGPSLTVAAPGVLGNDFGNGGGAMTAAVEAGVGHGTLTFAANGAFTYTPAPGFTGVDTFTYRASNGNGASAATTVTIRVMLPPVVVNDAYAVASPDTLIVPEPGVLHNDHFNGAPFINASVVNTVAHGSLTLYISGRLVYTPEAGFVGTDSFTYLGVSEGGTSNVATVTITVTAPTGPPPPGPPPGPPSGALPPTGLIVDAVAGQLVTVRFTAPAAGLPPLSYVLKGGVVPGQVLAALATGSTAPIFSFVAPVGSFLIRVHTQTAAGESGPSNEVPLHVGVPAPPSPPSALTAMVNGSSVALSWKNTFGGGPPASMFLDVAGSQNVSLPLGLSESFTYPAVPGGSYTFRVRAANAGGTSAPSNAATAAFPGACSGVPLPPARFLAYRVGTTLNVVWDPPASGAAPTHYLLQVTGAFSGTFPIPVRHVSAPVGPGTYGLSVRAVNDCGSSGATAEQTVVVP